LVVVGDGVLYLPQSQNIWGAVFWAHNRFHDFPPRLRGM
jgi:hypothetical protein